MVLDIKFNTSLSKPKSANTTISLLLAAIERRFETLVVAMSEERRLYSQASQNHLSNLLASVSALVLPDTKYLTINPPFSK